MLRILLHTTEGADLAFQLAKLGVRLRVCALTEALRQWQRPLADDGAAMLAIFTSLDSRQLATVRP